MSGFSAGEGGEAAIGAGSKEMGQRSPGEIAAVTADTVKSEVATFASDAREKVAERAQGAAETATRTLGEFASAIQKAGNELSEHDQSMAGKIVKQAGDGLENLARSIADKGPEELIDAAREFGRRNPLAFVAGGVLLGLAAGRFLRSSPPPTTAQVDSGARSFNASTAYRADDNFDGPGSQYTSPTSEFGTPPAVDTDLADPTPLGRAPYSGV